MNYQCLTKSTTLGSPATSKQLAKLAEFGFTARASLSIGEAANLLLECVTHARNEKPRGVHHRAKLTIGDVREIRASKRSLKAEAERHNISDTTIHNIRTRTTWKRVLDLSRGGRDVSTGATDPIMIGKLRAGLAGAYPAWRVDLPFITWCLERHRGICPNSNQP